MGLGIQYVYSTVTERRTCTLPLISPCAQPLLSHGATRDAKLILRAEWEYAPCVARRTRKMPIGPIATGAGVLATIAVLWWTPWSVVHLLDLSDHHDGACSDLA